MKLFTVKDFISDNNPCFGCGDNIYFYIQSYPKTEEPVMIRPTVRPDYTSVDLKVTYAKTLQLWIFHQTNKIIASDNDALVEYLDNHDLKMKSICGKCNTTIKSNVLEFNLDKGYIKPASINFERIYISDNHNAYEIYTEYSKNKSKIAVRNGSHYSSDALIIDAPLMPLYRFKDKEHLMNKLKTYLTFS